MVGFMLYGSTFLHFLSLMCTSLWLQEWILAGPLETFSTANWVNSGVTDSCNYKIQQFKMYVYWCICCCNVVWYVNKATKWPCPITKIPYPLATGNIQAQLAKQAPGVAPQGASCPSMASHRLMQEFLSFIQDKGYKLFIHLNISSTAARSSILWLVYVEHYLL